MSGDLIAASQNITVNGRIEGDIIAAAQDIVVNGEVGGNVRIAGNSLIINGTVARNVNAFGAKILFGSGSRIGWDVFLAGANLETRGTIDGSLNGHAGQALIAGNIGKDMNLDLSRAASDQALIIAPETIINGDVNYTSRNAAQVSDRASIAGSLNQNLPAEAEKDWFSAWIWGKLFSIFSALVVGLVLIYLGKNITLKTLANIKEAPLKTLLPGLIITFIMPPIAFVLLFTLIGIPLALITLTAWLILIYIAKIMTAILIGQLIINKLSQKSDWPLIWPLIIGVIISWLIFSIPFVGWVLGLIAIWLGLGGLWIYASGQLRNI